MSSGPENKVKNAVKRQLKTLAAYQFWPVQTGMGAKTVDCLASVRGRFVGIETKAPGKVPTALQEAALTAIESSGGVRVVIDSVAMAKCLPEILKNAGIDLAPE